MLAAFPLVLLAALGVQEPDSDRDPEPAGPLIVDLGLELPALRVERDEELVYAVRVLGGVEVGTLTLRSGVEPYRASTLDLDAERETGREQAWMEARAVGDYVVYSMDTSIESRHLPQDWPRMITRYHQTGTERRRREVKTGLVEGVPTASYRGDTSAGAPEGQRIWRPTVSREIPAAHVDTLSAIWAVRSFLRDGAEVRELPLIDKQRVWTVELRRGERRVQKTAAGEYATVEVQLSARPAEGEAWAEAEGAEFRGFFGLPRLRLWFCERTGVPVRIEGAVPIGDFDLDVDITLVRASRAPEGFGEPLPEADESE